MSSPSNTRRPLWKVLTPVVLIVLALVTALGWHYRAHFALQWALARGAPQLAPYGGKVTASWTDAAKNGWTTIETAAAGISLDGSTITDGDLKVLTEFPNVYQVSLRNTAVTDAAIEQLKQLPNLRVVRLEGTQIAPEAQEQLKEFLNERSERARLAGQGP